MLGPQNYVHLLRVLLARALLLWPSTRSGLDPFGMDQFGLDQFPLMDLGCGRCPITSCNLAHFSCG